MLGRIQLMVLRPNASNSIFNAVQNLIDLELKCLMNWFHQLANVQCLWAAGEETTLCFFTAV